MIRMGSRAVWLVLGLSLAQGEAATFHQPVIQRVCRNDRGEVVPCPKPADGLADDVFVELKGSHEGGSTIHDWPEVVFYEDHLAVAFPNGDGTYDLGVRGLVPAPSGSQVAVIDLDDDGRTDVVWWDEPNQQLLGWYGVDDGDPDPAGEPDFVLGVSTGLWIDVYHDGEEDVLVVKDDSDWLEFRD